LLYELRRGKQRAEIEVKKLRRWEVEKVRRQTENWEFGQRKAEGGWRKAGRR